MNVTESMDIIKESITQALEKVAFLEVMAPEDENKSPDDIIVAEIGFVGHISGRIQIASEREFVTAFAENMCGMDDLSTEQYDDALKELANITCGLVLPMLAESQKEDFNMTVPYLTTLSPPKWQDFVAEDDTVLLEVEGHLICVKLEIHK
jgi:chemotaxis protein CheY-P-specific phosphatase CheC